MTEYRDRDDREAVDRDVLVRPALVGAGVHAAVDVRRAADPRGDDRDDATMTMR